MAKLKRYDDESSTATCKVVCNAMKKWPRGKYMTISLNNLWIEHVRLFQSPITFFHWQGLNVFCPPDVFAALSTSFVHRFLFVYPFT